MTQTCELECLIGFNSTDVKISVRSKTEFYLFVFGLYLYQNIPLKLKKRDEKTIRKGGRRNSNCGHMFADRDKLTT